MPLSSDLVKTAEERCELKPSITEADLRRATSDCYYAMFHAICETLVSVLGSDAGNDAIREAYDVLYRQPDHAYLDKRCREVSRLDFDPRLKAFARQISEMQNKRHQADYYPLAKFSRTNVFNDVAKTSATVRSFHDTAQAERVRFAFFVSLRGRKD
ncbi:MAG: hypothetical protein AAGH70_05280 [Pseudomonadota bacterium]